MMSRLELGLTNRNERRTKTNWFLFYRREAVCYTLGYNYSLFAHRVHDVLTCITAVAGIAGAAGVHLMGTGACELCTGRPGDCFDGGRNIAFGQTGSGRV